LQWMTSTRIAVPRLRSAMQNAPKTCCETRVTNA
jgi:hypothetical protein